MLNRFTAIGRLTRDPELRRTLNGTGVADFSLALTERYNGKDGEAKEETVYTDWVVWNGSSENFCKLVGKGDLVYVEGKYKVEKWQDKTDGTERSKGRFTVLTWKLLSKVGQKSVSAETDEEESPAPAKKRGRPAKSEAKKPESTQPIDNDDEEDPIPF